MELKSPVSEIKKIGSQREKLLNSMGIFTVEDLLEHFPRDYDDRSYIREISDLVENESNTFIATVETNAENIYVGKMCITRARVSDDSGSITLIWYNQKFLKNVIKKDMTFIFTGKYQKKNGRREVLSPEYEAMDKEELLSGGRITPVYSTTAGLSQKVLRGLIKDTIDKAKNGFTDFMPKTVRMENKLCERNFAIENIHFPENDDAFFMARKRLVFEELFVLQTALFRIKSNVENENNGIVMPKKRYLADAKKMLGFEMTNAQKKVADEICADLSSGRVMNRLVQGDVGSGKTAVALCAAYIAIKNGYQCVLMAPTEVLAKQHYEYFVSIFEKAGINVKFLSGSLKKKEKDAVYTEIESGTAQMIIGTHAVIQKNVVFKNAGLVITDEQHRFGVNQRLMLSQKGQDPHVLVMTATPIPRTLALILYGDLDISIIDELPPGREKIDTLAVNSSYHKRIYEFIKKEIADGGQAYIVCPMIEENDEIE
ncbi:MAG: ATP-dependent DNA helicase RecG, partial [Firmicutes bacterium]|nr:ATP-dependent DNA helicase RecG [Bacillota bacterium]